MRSAGIFRDVAADRARDLRRGIGRVEQPVRGRGLGNREVAHARLNDGDRIRKINFLNPIHLHQRKRDSLLGRNAAADVTETGAARRHCNFFLRCKFEQFRDV